MVPVASFAAVLLVSPSIQETMWLFGDRSGSGKDSDVNDKNHEELKDSSGNKSSRKKDRISSSIVDGVPVIPGAGLFTGHLHLLREQNFEKALRKWSVEHANDEGRVTFWMGPTTPSLSVLNPADVQTLLRSSSHRKLFGVLNIHMEQFFGRYNLAALTGREWKVQRSIIAKAFHGQRVIENNKLAFVKATQTLANSLGTVCNHENNTTSRTYYVDDIQRLMQMLTLDAFGLACLDEDFGCCQKLEASQIALDFEWLGQEMMRRFTSPIDITSYIYNLPTPSNRKFKQVNSRVESFVAKIVQDRRQLLQRRDQKVKQDELKLQNEEHLDIPQDLLTFFIEASSSPGSDNGITSDGAMSGTSFTQSEEKEELMMANVMKSLLFAGFETSSTALTFILYLLSQHPDTERRCLNEIENDKVSGAGTGESNSLCYLDAVITEALRLYPPAISTTRSLERDVVLNENDWKKPVDTSNNEDGCSEDVKEAKNEANKESSSVITVPKGTYLYFPIWTIQRDERNFPDPLKFCPERWVYLDGENGCWLPRTPMNPETQQGQSALSPSPRSSMKTMIPPGNHEAFVAFSAGARSCAGERFARNEMRTALSILLPRFHFQPPDDYELNVHRPGIVISPTNPIPMTISER